MSQTYTGQWLSRGSDEAKRYSLYRYVPGDHRKRIHRCGRQGLGGGRHNLRDVSLSPNFSMDSDLCYSGFDTSFIPRFPVIAHGVNVQDRWKDYPVDAYMSIAVKDTPNARILCYSIAFLWLTLFTVPDVLRSTWSDRPWLRGSND